MFYDMRYQTGEIQYIINDMKDGKIPCMDVSDSDEFLWFINELKKHGIYEVEGLQYDKNARNRIKEPDFEFRVGFYTEPLKSEDVNNLPLMYIDFYFEPIEDKSYDPVGEM